MTENVSSQQHPMSGGAGGDAMREPVRGAAYDAARAPRTSGALELSAPHHPLRPTRFHRAVANARPTRNGGPTR
ncbi:MAG TPA: hypothetical protein VFS05_04455 [Gemmatimonadaceae bacterium]|nr:hypothetical protein [Gemmatimonadaceae bacterium]